MSRAMGSSSGFAAMTFLGLLAASPVQAQGQSVGRALQAAAPRAVAPTPAAQAPAAPSGTGDVARSAFIQSMDVEYRKQDLDGDGKVTRAEVEQFERNAALAKSQAQNRALFASLDADRNGVISPGEFATLVRNIPMPDVSAQMQRFDTNRDQVISLVEYRTATLINFDRLDADKDGIVTERELAASSTVSAVTPSGR